MMCDSIPVEQYTSAKTPIELVLGWGKFRKIAGQLWQFKPFKRWHSNPVEIFAKIPAFHVHYDDLNIDPNVAKWSVTRLPVSRTTRHMDKARFRVFWEVLDRWIPANRPHLRW
ncbi:RNA pol II accessory factor Cdc73 family [Trichostrongylus colubriformis]|uniref:RNA pol II accessory factor Cdc73 family n=1 Tax=Trichostrongylus colubriformis TaxID=6319 RepID=A0AAN8F3K1_TRICO